MAIEMERKFLLVSDGWRPAVESSGFIRDGLLATSDGGKVRIRIRDGAATLTVKTRQVGCVRQEFEYAIPVDDAERILDGCCGGNIIVKCRHLVRHEGYLWEIDEYDGILKGIILAEVEFDHAGQDIPLPEWVGEEVTAKPAYKKISMLRARQHAKDICEQ